MTFIVKMVLAITMGLTLVSGTGCAPTKVWLSKPAIQSAGNAYYETSFEPLKRNDRYFAAFRLTVANKTGKPMEIDWNKTLYLFNGNPNGVFVFRGIKPEDIKNGTVPPDLIPARGRFSREISPYKLIARSQISSRTLDAGEIKAGMLPKGNNGVHLVVRQEGNDIVEKIFLQIEEKEVR